MTIDIDQWGDTVPELYFCPECNGGFQTFVGVEVHLREHHDIIAEIPRHAYPCRHCDKVFETKQSANRHSAYVHKDREQYRKTNVRFYGKGKK